MRRLFTDNDRYTEEALRIDREIFKALQDVLESHPDVSVRDFGALAHGSVVEVVCVHVLSSRKVK
jgi:hypothetical protein